MVKMAKFYRLKVAEVVKETADCVSIAFDVPAEAAGEFNYIQGQYLTLKLNINGEDVRRSYSICSSTAAEEKLRVAIKKVQGGKGSVYLNDQVKAGDVLEVMTPMGNFHTRLDSAHRKNYILFAGGSGITPMLSIIKTVLHVEPSSNIVLFYGNQNEASVIFRKQLDSLSAQHPERLKVHHILAEPAQGTAALFTGMMTKDKNLALIENFVGLNQDNEYFICGPTGMMDSVVAALTSLQIEKARIHVEYFTPPLEESDIKQISDADLSSFVRCEVTIICDGEETTITVEPGENILDKAIDANVDAPYACKGGSCCTCRALLVEGKVEMAVNFALLESEVEEGYILTCQSHPLTPRVVVDYDRGR
jgi:ring-1,2-phenylacetyl-CoA epoxidase subunit PaaE